MRLRTKLCLTWAAGMLFGGADMESRAGAGEFAVGGVPWWFQGYLEAGGRGFANDPLSSSLAKYYEYRDLRPGPFVDGRLLAGRADGLDAVDFEARNVGYRDQNYLFDFSRAGTDYLSVVWDQTPHVYSTSAQTIYNGSGTGALTLPAGLSNQLFIASGGGGFVSPAQAAQVQSIINANVHPTDLAIRRDTLSVENRWTPTEAWDVRVNYANTRRTGTQVEGISFQRTAGGGAASQVAAPVADTTQNFGVSGEYAGTSPWGQKFNTKVGYAGSTYTDDLNSYTVENPFCATGAPTCAPGGGSGPLARMSMWPDNQANAFSGTVGADLPLKSRYMATVTYEQMRQNQPFLPFTINPNSGAVINGQNASSLGALPATSLNGAINTMLVNNVLTTQLTPELKSKATYRYYNYSNDTPEIRFPNWVVNDTIGASNFFGLAPVSSLSLAYTRQNVGEELTWRPTRQWNIGAAYGYERYDWTRFDATATGENTVKAFVDWKPTVWITARASWLSGERRYEGYDYLNLVGMAQWPTDGALTRYSTAMRQFYLDNRDRNKGQFSLAVDLARGLTVTPTFGILNDDYQIAPTELGLKYSHSTHAGIEVAYALNPDTTFLFSYMKDRYDKFLRSSITSAGTVLTLDNTYSANIKDDVDTYYAAINFAMIPGKLDLRFGYTLSMSNNSQPVIFGNNNLPATGQYPNITNNWQRIDATARYKFDPILVARLGWTGDVYAKFYYAFERNEAINWQNDAMQTYMYSVSNSTGYMTWLAYNNPNYDVHRIAGSLTFAW